MKKAPKQQGKTDFAFDLFPRMGLGKVKMEQRIKKSATEPRSNQTYGINGKCAVCARGQQISLKHGSQVRSDITPTKGRQPNGGRENNNKQ